MSKEPIISVAGVTRCGSTMMMNMLGRGGMDLCEESEVSHEDSRVIGLPHRHEWLSCAEGKAVKLLDIHEFTPPKGLKYLFVFMSRDPKQQAKSMQKFMMAVGAIGHRFSKRDMARMVQSIIDDTAKGLKICKERGPVLEMAFEEVIEDSFAAAQKVHNFILFNTGKILRIRPMAESVVKRSTKCLDYMLELRLMGGGE